MNIHRLAPLLLLGATVAATPGHAQEGTGLEGAAWIWASEASPTGPTPVCAFRKTFELDAVPASATISITADNVYELYVNGTFVGGDGGVEAVYWRSIERHDVGHLLVVGPNVVAVEARCLGGAAGLLAAVHVNDGDGTHRELVTGETWLWGTDREPGWNQPDVEEGAWRASAVIAPAGGGVWGPLTFPEPRSPGPRVVPVLVEPGPDFAFPAGVVFVADDVEVSDPVALNIFRIGESRAYYENDIPSPAALGRRLYALEPASPAGEPRLLVDAGAGVLGSPGVTFDGASVLFTMAPAGEEFFHLYSVEARGSAPVALTSGPFHDYDPCPLPDGRVVFSSTRIGSRDEYHGNVASSLFVLDADGGGIQPLTHHIVGDREPRVTADGGLAFIRSDNFLERAKIETHIRHTRLDGTGGEIVVGPERGVIGLDPLRGAEHDSAWLRQYGAGSPAPLPDGRVAAITHQGLVVAGDGQLERLPVSPTPYDVAPLPDGRLLCTLADRGGIGVIEPASGQVTLIHSSADLHSVTYLGPRPHPPTQASGVQPTSESGFLLCQNVWHTKQSDIDPDRIRAVRVFEGQPLTVRSVGHHLVHIGVEAVELGTVPLAPDGSFYIEVPADRALALQAVDAQGRGVVNEMTWIYVRPGEVRSCTGCHQPRRSTPEPSSGALAASAAPLALLGQGRAHRYRGNNAANGGVVNLQLDRMREVASIDLHTQAPLQGAEVDAYLAPGRQAEIARLHRELVSDQTELRVSAARRLGIFRDAASTAVLVEALGDRQPEVRCAAALALSACADRSVVPHLLDALLDRHPLVAQAAARVLESLTARPVEFNAFAADRQREADRVRRWFEEYDWPELERDLASALSGSEPLDAIEALGHESGDVGRAALLDYLEKHWRTGEVRPVLAAVRALGHRAETRAVPLLVDILEGSLQLDPGPSPHLHELGWLGRHVHLSAAAAEALGWIATPAAEEALVALWPRLQDFSIYTFQAGDHDWLRGCHASPIHFRFLEAFDALGTRDLAKLVPGILRSTPIDPDRGLLLENDSYETMVARVVQRTGLTSEVVETALAQLGDPRASATAELTAALTTSPPAREVKPASPEGRAAQLLSVVILDAGHAPAIRAALERYRRQPPSRTRSYVCFYLCRALGKVHDDGSADLLTSILLDDPTEASYGLHAPPNAFVYRATPPFHRATAAVALGRIGSAGAAETLMTVVEDFDNALSVRNAAAIALGEVGNADCSPRLAALAAEYPEVITRRALLEAHRRAQLR